MCAYIGACERAYVRACLLFLTLSSVFDPPSTPCNKAQTRYATNRFRDAIFLLRFFVHLATADLTAGDGEMEGMIEADDRNPELHINHVKLNVACDASCERSKRKSKLLNRISAL